MIKDIVIGVVMIVYVLATICTYTLTKELILDVASAAIPELSKDFREYTQHKPALALSTLLFSILPGVNLIVAYSLYTKYDSIRESMTKEFMEGPEWERFQEKYQEVLRHESN